MSTRNEEIRYRRLFEAAYDGILILDFDTGRIQDVNPYLVALLGYDRAELLGKELWQIGAMIDKNASIKAFATLKKDGYIKYSDLPLQTKSGKIISVEFVSNAYGVNGDRVIQCNIRDITDRKNSEAQLIRYQDAHLRNMYEMVDALTKVVVSRDPYTYFHQVRVSHLAVAIATEMRFSTHAIEGLRLAALIHDIGKISVPSEILTKPSALTNAEMEILQGHVMTGYNIVKDINFQWPIALMILQHHCRSDGSGYPKNLRGESILSEARILAVADTVEAMSFSRPYRPAFSQALALKEVGDGAGSRYDCDVAGACLRVFKSNGYQFPSVAS